MPLVFRGVGSSDIASLVHRAIAYVQMSPVDEIPLFQFARHFTNEMDKNMMDRVLGTLQAMKTVKIINKPQADTIIKRLGVEKDED